MTGFCCALSYVSLWHLESSKQERGIVRGEIGADYWSVVSFDSSICFLVMVVVFPIFFVNSFQSGGASRSLKCCSVYSPQSFSTPNFMCKSQSTMNAQQNRCSTQLHSLPVQLITNVLQGNQFVAEPQLMSYSPRPARIVGLIRFLADALLLICRLPITVLIPPHLIYVPS